MTDTLVQGLASLLGGKVSGEVIIFIISMIPILELRGGLLAASPALLNVPILRACLLYTSYNQVMAEELTAAGLGCNIIPRKADEDGAISASEVRCLIRGGNFEALKKKVPACTFQYFTSEAAEPVIQKIRSAAEVRHY